MKLCPIEFECQIVRPDGLIDVTVTANFIPGSPPTFYRSNGDPGDPGDPDEVEVVKCIRKADGVDIADELTEADALCIEEAGLEYVADKEQENRDGPDMDEPDLEDRMEAAAHYYEER